MADKKAVDQLKMERTTAKASFTRLVNSLTRNHDDLSEEELRDSFKTLITAAEKVMEANEKVEAKLLTQLKDGETELTQAQREDLDNTSKECESKRTEVKGLLQKTLWDKFGKDHSSSGSRGSV